MMKLLRKICSFVLCVALVFSVFGLDYNHVYAEGKGDQIHTGEGDTNESSGTTDWATSWSVVYKVSLFTENHSLTEEELKAEGLEGAPMIEYKTLTYFPSWKAPFNEGYVNFMTNNNPIKDNTKPFGLVHGFSDYNSYRRTSINTVLNDSFSDYFLIVDDTADNKKLFGRNTSVGGGVANLKGCTVWDGSNGSVVTGGCRSIKKASELMAMPIFGITDKKDFDEMLRVSADGKDYLGFSASCDPAIKDEVLRTISSFGNISYNSADCDRTLILVERCILCNYRSGTPANSIKSGSAGTGYDSAGLVTWRNMCAQYGNIDHQMFAGTSSHNGVSFRISDIVCPSLDSGANGGKFYVGQTYAPIEGTNSLVHTIASSIQNNHGDLVPWGNLATWGKGFHSDVSGFFLYGFAGGDPVPNDATNTLAIYDDVPVEGSDAVPDKWQAASSIVDGVMPELVEGDFSSIKYYDTNLHMWVTPANDNKTFGKLINAVKDGGEPYEDADFVQGDKKVYALIARESYKTSKVYNEQKFDTVIKTNGVAKSEIALDAAPNKLKWGGDTVEECSGEPNSFGKVVTIATINGDDYKTNGLMKYAEQLGLAGEVEQHRGTLDGTKTVMTQIKDEIKSAQKLSGGKNYEGEGAETHFTTADTTLGSAIEILVKAAPVESSLHVISVSGGVGSYLPNVKDYDYTNVDWGISKPKEDSGVEKIVAIGVAPKGTLDGGTLASSFNGMEDEDAIKASFLTQFTNPNGGSFDGDVPKINVGNITNNGYDIYILTTDTVTVSSEKVELPDYLLNLYYNRILFYTNSGASEYKVNWNQHTYPSDETDLGSNGVSKVTCFYHTNPVLTCPIDPCGADKDKHSACGKLTDADNANEHKHNPCPDFYRASEVKDAYEAGAKYWVMVYKDTTPTSGDNLSMKWEEDSGNTGKYYLRANYTGTDTETEVWSNSKVSKLRAGWGTAKINTNTTEGKAHNAADAGKNYLFDYAFNLTRSSNYDRRTLSGIGYASIDDSPRENFLQLKFGVVPDSPLKITALRNSYAYVTDKDETVRITSTFEFGGSQNDNSNTSYSDWTTADGLNVPKMTCTHTTESKLDCGKDESDEPDGHKHSSGCYHTYCTSATHDYTTESKVCIYDGGVKKVPNGSDLKSLGFVNHYGSHDQLGTIMCDSGQEFTKRVYKYQTAPNLPSGSGHPVRNDNVKQTVFEGSKVPDVGNITDTNMYRLAYVKDNGFELTFYPEVQMGYYSVGNEDFPAVDYNNTYLGINLTDGSKPAVYENSGAAFNSGTAGTLYTMGEEKRSVQGSSLYLYRFRSTKDKTVTGKTFSDSPLSSTQKYGSNLISIPAGSDISVNAEPDGMVLDLYGYSLDIIRTDDEPSGKKYKEWVKSGEDVAAAWGNSNHKAELLNQFKDWADDMRKTSKYNADFILSEVNPESGSKVYNNFTAAIGKFENGSTPTETGCYIIKVEHGILDESFGGYKALLEQIKEDYGLGSVGEAKSLFWASGIPQSIIDSMETEKNDLNKSFGHAKNQGSLGFKAGVHSAHQGKGLGSSDHWYDEMTRTFVVRRFTCTGNEISSVTLQDKLDFGSAGNTTYGKNSDKRGNTGITGTAVWNLSIYLTDSANGGLIGNTKPDEAVCGLSGDMYLPRNNGGTTYGKIVDGMKPYVDDHKVILYNAYVNGADFSIPSSTTANFGD